MRPNGARVRLGRKVEHQARRDVFVALEDLVARELAGADALLDAIVVGVHGSNSSTIETLFLRVRLNVVDQHLPTISREVKLVRFDLKFDKAGMDFWGHPDLNDWQFWHAPTLRDSPPFGKTLDQWALVG